MNSTSFPLAKFCIEIHDIQYLRLSNSGWPKRPGKLYVQLMLDGVKKQTKVSERGNAASWTESFYFDACGTSILDFRVYAQHMIGRDELIGSVKGRVDLLLVEGASSVITRELCIDGADGNARKTESSVEFSVTLASKATAASEMDMDDAVRKATTTFEQMKMAPSQTRDSIAGSSSNDDTNSIAATWDSLLQKLELFTKIVDGISEVHPYAKMAWSILSMTYRTILAQKLRDDSIGHLVEVMVDVYGFVLEAECVKKAISHERILGVMVQQTTECAYFIREYTMNGSFRKRFLANVLSDTDNKIKQYEDKFRELKRCFQERAVLQTEITVVRILDIVESLVEDVDMSDIPYAAGARFNRDKSCLPGTRQGIIEEITQWINSPNGDEVPRVYFLSGVAGSGKSAIAHTIAQQFDQLGRLGSSFCFDRSDQARRRPNNVFSTITLDIADLDPQWKTSLRNVVRGKRALRSTIAIGEQFTDFIVKPSEALTTVGPVVIVIDALDDSGDRASREVLLNIIAQRMRDLPDNFRVLVTSRPEPDIYEALKGSKHVYCKDMDSIDKKTNEADISLYIQTQLCHVPGLDLEWPNQEWCRILVNSSDGLFQWASTACAAIKGGKGSLRPTERLTRFITSARGLDGLYTEILEQAFDSSDSQDILRFTLIMGRILASQEPLSVASLLKLRSEGEQADVVELVVRPLGSLLTGVNHTDVAVRPLHASFRDFLTCEQRSSCFYVDLSLQHRNLAMACWRVMKAELRFNICELETSHIRNADIPGLGALVTKCIPAHLSYACRFWAVHVQGISFEAESLEIIKSFFFDHFLQWLEVLSLTRQLSIASSALQSTLDWLKNHDQELVDFVTDAKSFVSTFRFPISQSTPHIYLSALPFAPSRSIISRHFLPQFPHLLSVDVGKSMEWPVGGTTFDGHTGAVYSVAYSPDSKRIASCSGDCTVRVWDVETGELVAGPIEGHTNLILSLAFSPDQKRIVSGSADQTVRVWYADTGEVVAGPFEGHLNTVYAVAYSPDGQRIVSGSEDTTVHVWDAETGEIVAGPFKGHTGGVKSVAYSPDGKRIVSGSIDQTVRVWDAETGNAALFIGHTGAVLSVAYSPDGKQIVSGSRDWTVRVWNAEAGSAVSWPFEGHTGSIYSVAYSPDGQRIVSGSSDRTVRVWDAGTGKVVAGPFEGHTRLVYSVAYSPDSTRIVSGSRDRTVRVWDPGMVEMAAGPFEGHTNAVYSVAYSPDGKRIMSGSYDRTVRVWDAETGELVARPFEGHTDCVYSVVFSPDGRRVVSGSLDKTVRVWDADTGELVAAPFEGHTNFIHSIAYSPDGKQIASGSGDGTVRVWDAETGKMAVAPFEGHIQPVWSVAFSPDQKRIVSGSKDHTVRVWNVNTGAAVATPFEGHTASVNSVAYSPDGKRIVSGSEDLTVRVWEAETGGIVAGPFEGHTAIVYSVAYSPDGGRIISGSADQTVRVWDAETGEVVAEPFKGHTDSVMSVAYSPDGRRIVSGSMDQTVRVWDTLEASQLIVQPFERPMEPSSSTSYPSVGHSISSPNKTSSSARHTSVVDTSLHSGWVLGNQSELLFWVPPQNRIGLWGTRNTTVISRTITRLGFRDFIHGEAWYSCRSSGLHVDPS